MDIKPINRRKTKFNYMCASCIPDRDPGKLNNLPKRPKPLPSYHLQLKTKDTGVGGNWLWEMTRKSTVNKGEVGMQTEVLAFSTGRRF